MAEEKKVILAASIADLKKQINGFRDEIVKARAEGSDYTKSLDNLRAAQAELNTVMKLGKEDVSALQGSYNAMQAELTKLKRQWKATNDEAERNRLGQKISEITNDLKALDASIGVTTRNVGNYSSALEGASGEMENLKKEIRENTLALQNMQQGTKEYDELLEKTGQLKDKFNDLQASIRYAADDARGLNTAIDIAKVGTAMYGIWTSAASLFGAENSKVVEVIKKLQVAATMLNSLKEVQLLLFDRGSRIYQLYNKAVAWVTTSEKAETKEIEKNTVQKGINAGATNKLAGAEKTAGTAIQGTTKKINGFRAALLGAGIGIAITLLATLISNWDKLTNAIKKSTKAEVEFNKGLDEAKKKGTEAYSKTLTDLYTGYKKLQAEWRNLTSEHKKSEWIKNNQTEFKNLGTEIRNATDAEKIFNGNDQKMIESFTKRAQAAAAAAEAVELYQQAFKLEQEKLDLDTKFGEKVANATGRTGRYNAHTGEEVGGYSADDERKSIIAEWQRQTGEIEARQKTLMDRGNALMNQSVQLGSQTTSNWASATSAVTNYVDEVEQAANADLEVAQQAREYAKNEAQKEYLNGLITEIEYKEKLLNADKQYEADLGNLAFKYQENTKLKVKFNEEADKQCRENEIKSIELNRDKVAKEQEKTAKEAAERIKNTYKNALSKIDINLDIKTTEAEHGFEMDTLGLDSENLTVLKAMRNLIQNEFNLREQARQDEITATEAYYDELIRQAEANAAEQERLEQEKQAVINGIQVKGKIDYMKTTQQVSAIDQQITKARLKIWTGFANGMSSLMNAVGDIMQENIQRRYDEGEISQKQAEEEFERQKALQYSTLWIQTIAGATGAFMQDKKAYPAPWNYIIAGIDLASTLATGIAQTIKIKNTKFGGGGDSGGSSAPSAPTIQDVQVAPLLNERVDAQTMTAMNTSALLNKSENQRVYILQSDITKSNDQVKTRVSQTTF